MHHCPPCSCLTSKLSFISILMKVIVPQNTTPFCTNWYLDLLVRLPSGKTLQNVSVHSFLSYKIGILFKLSAVWGTQFIADANEYFCSHCHITENSSRILRRDFTRSHMELWRVPLFPIPFTILLFRNFNTGWGVKPKAPTTINIQTHDCVSIIISKNHRSAKVGKDL